MALRGSGPLATYTYAYNAATELTTYTGPEGTLTYTYNNNSELTNVGGARLETYSYDANGNRNMSGYSVTTGNRLTSDGTYNYTYDDEGNVLTQTKISNGEKFEFEWDYRNRLTKVLLKNSGGTVLKEERYTYDLWNRRIGIWVDADGAGSGVAVQTWTVYDGANPYADFTSGGSLINRYLYGNAIDWLFARVDSANDEDWYLTDRLGSVRQIGDTNGTVVTTLTYDSYGQQLSESTPAQGDRLTSFAGMERSSIGGPSKQGARDYLFAGVWASADPIGFSAGDSNLTRYSRNSSTNFVDRDGFSATTPDDKKTVKIFPSGIKDRGPRRGVPPVSDGKGLDRALVVGDQSPEEDDPAHARPKNLKEFYDAVKALLPKGGVLEIYAHGWVDHIAVGARDGDTPRFHGPDEKITAIGPSNAAQVGRKLKDLGVVLLYLTGCGCGNATSPDGRPWPQVLADESGATVVAPNGKVVGTVIQGNLVIVEGSNSMTIYEPNKPPVVVPLPKPRR